MSNPFDQFDAGNPFDQFDAGAAPRATPAKIGKDANADFLRAEMQNADPFTRNLASAGTALSGLWEGTKQLFGKGDAEQIANNRIMEEEAPVGAVVGNVAMTAIPFMAAGNSIKAAAKVGAALGATRPIEGEQTFENIASGKAKNIVLDTVLAGAGQKIANTAGGLLANKARELHAAKAANAPRDAALARAMEEGLVAPPSSINPSFGNVTAESVAGKIGIAQTASNQNAPIFEKLLRRSIGLADDAPLTVEAAQAVRAKAYQDGFKPIADLPAINWDHQLLFEAGKLSPKSAGGAVKSAAQGEIDDLISAITKQNQWTGPQLIGDIQALREQAAANFRGGAAEKALARAQKDAAKLLEGLAERNILIQGGNPGQVQAMRDARTLIAKAHTAEESILKGGNSPDARVFAKRVEQGKPLSGEQEIIGRFAKNFPKASQPVSQIAGPGVSKLNSFAALLGGGAGHLAGGPVLGAAMAAAPFVVPPAMRKALLSRYAQKNALASLYQLGVPTRGAVGALQYAPVGLTELGREAFP